MKVGKQRKNQKGVMSGEEIIGEKKEIEKKKKGEGRVGRHNGEDGMEREIERRKTKNEKE